MEIILPRHDIPAYKSIGGLNITRGNDSEISTQNHPVEHPLSIWIDGTHSFDITCTPTQLPELVIGRLFSDGLIRGKESVISLEFSPDGKTVYVKLDHSADSVLPSEPEKPSEIKFENDWIFTLSETLQQKMETPVYMATGNTHSTMLMHDGRIVVCCEDLGRHSAIDKAVGWALLNDIDLHTSIIYTSGRLPLDMVMKIIRAGIPIVVSKAQPTCEAIELAKSSGITVLFNAHPDSFIRL